MGWEGEWEGGGKTGAGDPVVPRNTGSHTELASFGGPQRQIPAADKAGMRVGGAQEPTSSWVHL